MKAKFFTSGALAAAAILVSSVLSPAYAAGLRGRLSFEQADPDAISFDLVKSISDPVVDFNNDDDVFEVNAGLGDFAAFVGSKVTVNDINLSTFSSGFQLFTIAGGPTFTVREFVDPVFRTGRFDAEVRGFFTNADGSKSEATSILFSLNSNVVGDDVDFNLATVPTPAMLPGLIGMGVSALRRRKSEELEMSEV